MGKLHRLILGIALTSLGAGPLAFADSQYCGYDTKNGITYSITTDSAFGNPSVRCEGVNQKQTTISRENIYAAGDITKTRCGVYCGNNPNLLSALPNLLKYGSNTAPKSDDGGDSSKSSKKTTKDLTKDPYGALTAIEGGSSTAPTSGTTKDGKSWQIATGSDGSKVVQFGDGTQYNSDKSLVRSSEQVVVGDKTYNSRADWLAAGSPTGTDGAEIKNYRNNEIIDYDKNGNPVARYSMNSDGTKGKRITDSDSESKKLAASKGKKTDDCQTSVDLMGNQKYSCSGTNTLAKSTEVANQVLGSTGRNIVNQIGATAMQNAATAKQSDTLQNSAKMARTGFTYETALTTANIAAASMLGKKASQASQNMTDIRNVAATRKGVDSNYNSAQVTTALTEQADAKKTAQEGAYKAAITGVASLANAIVTKNNQKAMEKAANTQRQIENQLSGQNAINFDGTGMNTIGAGNGGDLNTLGAGGTTDPNAALNTTTPTDPNGTGGLTPTLGTGSDASAMDGGVGTLAHGNFKPGDAGGPGGGTGGGGMGVAAGGAPGNPVNAEEAKAQYATEFGTKERYENGTTPGGAAKGAAGGKGGDSGGGIDLNGLLAQFLPKDEKDLGAKNGILDYGFGGGRAPASVEEQPSYLDKNADLFQRIHETMSEKNRKGHVGL